MLDDYRLLIITMIVQYSLAAFIVASFMSDQIAAAKLVAGWIASAILLIYLRNTGWKSTESLPRNVPFSRFFRVVAVSLVLLVAVGVGSANWMMIEGIRPAIGVSTALLVCLSFLHLGLGEAPLRVGIGLLTFLTGFEITYSILEPSLAVIGLLACVHVGIALVAGYLMQIRDAESEQHS